MTSVLIHYFSGTGNTRHAVDVLAKQWFEQGLTVHLHSVEGCSAPQTQAPELHLFAFPVYACSLPDIMMNYMASLPDGHGAPAAIVAVFGEVHTRRILPGYEGQALVQAERVLRRRHYRPVYSNAAGYPFNGNVFGVLPTTEEQSKLIDAADGRVTAMARAIMGGQQRLKPCHWLNQLWSWLFGLVFRLMGRHLMGKLYVADGSCTGCGRCVQACPAKTIRLQKGKPRWGYQCQGCQRCMAVCPRRSIQTSLPRLITGVWLAFLPLRTMAGSSLSRLTDLALLDDLLVGMVAVLSYLVFFAIADLVFNLLEHTHYVGAALSWSFTRITRRYMAPGFHPDDQ